MLCSCDCSIMLVLICSTVHINNAVSIHWPVLNYKGILTEWTNEGNDKLVKNLFLQYKLTKLTASRSLKRYFNKNLLQKGGVYEKHIVFLPQNKFSTEGIDAIPDSFSPQVCSYFRSANVSGGTGTKQVYSTEWYVTYETSNSCLYNSLFRGCWCCTVMCLTSQLPLDIHAECPGGSLTDSVDWQVSKNIVLPAALILRGIGKVIQLHNS